MKPVAKQFVDAAKQAIADLGLKLDAVQTMAFARQLEVIESTMYEVEYPALKARSFLPVKNSFPAGARTITYRMWNRITTAKLLADGGAGDLPKVMAFGSEHSHNTAGFGNHYSYTVQDIREAAMLGMPVDTALQQAAVEGHEIAIDNCAAFGIPEVGMPGFVNHPNVPIVTLTTGTWASATTDQILEDLRMLAQSVVTRTLQSRAPNAMILPTELYGILQRPVGADYGSTIMSVFLAKNPYIKTIDQWVKLDTAGADAGPRIICYEKNPMLLELQVLLEFTQHAPQLNDLEFKVICESRVGGFVLRNPYSMSYADNAG
jgi:hypothetical protein